MIRSSDHPKYHTISPWQAAELANIEQKSTWKEVGLRSGENKHEFMTPELSSEFASMWSETELRAILSATDQ